MAYSIRLPDGTLVENIPDDLAPEQAKERIIKAFPQFAPPTSVTRRVLGDIPVGIAQGATTGVRMISDAFGAGNPVSESLKGVEEYLGGLLSAQATNNLDAMAKIIKESEDKGVLEQVKAGFKGLTEAPVEVVSQFLGTAAPTILAGVGGALAKVGATGIGAIQAGTGATMGAGLIKGNIYEVVKEELIKAKVDPEIAEERATFAQNYTGENWDQILLGTGLGGVAALGPLERIFARAPAIPTGIAAKNMVTRGVTAGVMEGAPEFTQAFQEQVANNIALQREGFDVPTYRGAVANATLEGLAGFGVGAPIGMISRGQKVVEPPKPPGAPQLPGAQPPGAQPPQAQPPVQPGVPPTAPGQPPTAQPPGTPPGVLPGMVTEEEELTSEEEAELQAQIAGAPPAAPMAAPPQVPPQIPPQAPETAAELEALNVQLAKVQARRMDPTISIDDYEAMENLDRQEREIANRIQALTQPPEEIVSKKQIPAVPTPPEIVSEKQIPEVPVEAVAEQQIEPTIEDQIRAQKSEERRQRQAEQETKKGEFVLQNRDRATPASLNQMRMIANKPDYGRAGFSRTPDGAPIVAFGDFAPEQLGREDVVTTARGRKIPVQYAVMEADDILTSNDIDGRPNLKYGDKDAPGTRAIAGNGRVAGIREAFNYRGRTEPYIEDMLADTALHGVDQDVIAGMKKPILVRVMPEEGLTRDIGDELNMPGMLELSPVEQARNDLNRVNLDNLEFNEDGEITNKSLDQFISGQPLEERSKLVDQGLPTKQARQRLENAIFAKAYDDNELIAMFAQAEDPEAKLVINALARVAPQMAKLEGAGDLDIRDIVIDAAKIIISGKRRGLKLTEIATQVDMTVDPDTRIIVDLFAQNPRSNKQAIEALINAATIAYEESAKPAESLFGAEPKMERRELVEQMRRGYEPGRTQDVAQAQRPGVAPSDVERQAEPSPAAVPPADQGFQLTGQTPEELAELERKEKTGQAQREQEEREAKAIAEREREIFTLSRTRAEPTPTAPPLKPPADMFGATGMADQPPRTAVEAPATPIEEAAKPATEAEESFKETVEIYVNDISSGAPTSTAATDYDEAANTITYVETWEGDFRTPPEELDELISGANKSDTAKGAKYSILVKDTPTESVVMTFQPRGRKPTDKYVDVFMSVQKITKEKPERTYKEEVEFFLNKKKLNDPETSKKIQESRGVSKPVADSYVRALRQRVEEQVKWTYGLGSEQAYKQAKDEVDKIENRIRGIEKRKETKQEKAAVPTPGDIIESIDLPDNMQVRILKAADGFSVQMYDKDSDNVVDGSVTIFKDSVFDEDAFKIAKEYADNLAEEVRQEAKEAEEVATEAKKEPVAGPTVTGMQAEIDRLKAEAKAKGVEPAPSAAVPDTTKQKQAERKKKEEAKKIKQATRSEIEYARFDDIGSDPIQATSEQLKMAEELAAQVKGELVFFDKDLNLGLVVVPNNLGFEDYFPIHGGKISKVDVAEYTGLSTADKSFLNRISRSIRVFRETSGKMLKGTAEQQEGILAVAEAVAGTPVYFDPDTNVGLVRGYALLTGQPIYAVTLGNSYSKVDVENTTAAPLLPYKAELIAVKKRLEAEAEKLHQENPFIKFEKGIASDGIDDSMLGVISEWKSMLGLDNVNIYFSTVEEAKKNRDKFTGPHRVIGSGTLDPNEGGSTRRMEDGSYYVLFKKSTSKTSMLETIAHEIGHVHEKEAYQRAPQELKNKLKEAHAEWVQQRKGKTPREAVEMLRAKTTAQTTSVSTTKTRAEELSPYWSSFSEWYADQVSRWAVTDEKPVGAVEKFFARLGAALRRFYQTLKGQKFLPNETFVQYLNQIKPTIVEAIPGPIKEPVQIEMSFKMQKDLFGSPEEAKKIEEIMEPKVKKLPPGRSPELTAAAQAVKAGTMTAEEFNKLVDTYKPIPVYAEPLKPATAEQVFDALDVKKREQINPPIPNGTKVGLRLDIPAFNRKGVFVVSIHQKRTASAPGKVIGYGSVAKAKNVTFGVGNQLKALDIAAGEAKDALQTIEGEYVNITPEQAFAEAQRAIKDPSYVQIGIDPTRHAYFYDRSTTLPVVSADEVIQIGNMILAKKPVFGKKENFLYNIESGPTPAMNKEEFKSLLEELRKEDDAKREVERQEKIAYYAGIRRKEVALQKKVREYGSTIDIQRQLNNLNRLARELKEDIDLDKSPVYTAESFLRQARAALEGRTPYKEPAISADVFAVIQAMYMDDPKLLEGLRLSIKPEFTPEEALLRSAFGYPRSSGAFESFRRVVYLYTGTKGVDNPATIRHEITHTLEQMMTPAQRQAVLSSYFNAVEKAAKKYKDARSQEFFEKLGEFLNNPNRKTKSALNKALPSYDFYQYVNPSEYWAVNAEKLMAQRLGTAWDRFKKAVRKMFEKLKDIFGFDNRYAVHQVFDQVMGGSKKRLTKDMLADFIFSSGERFDFLENIEDDAELMRRSGRGDTPMLDVSPMKRILIRGATNAKESFKEMVENPSEILRMTFNPINRGIIYLRNKNVWFGTGLNEADRIRYSGQVRTAEGIATASLALDNMIRSGNIATQVLFRGGIEYNPDTLMFGAVEKEQNMEKVYRAEAALKKKLGDQLGTNISNGYFEAKRSRNIKEEVVSRQQTLETLQEFVNDKVAEMKALDADPNATEKEINKVNKELRSLFREFQDAKKDLETIKKIAEDKVSMSEEMIEEFISREKVHPELKEMLDNFTAVNQNMLRFWRQVGLLSENRYNTLSRIKDYVPWYRIMNDEEDVHSPLQATTRSATNIGKEKLFGPGKPSVINDFIIEENQNVFKIQPGRVNVVKLEGKKLKPEDYEVTPQGEVTLKVSYKPGDVLIVETQREIENMIDNMTRNVMRMTMNGLRQYAAQRIVSEYATRDSDGKIMTFNKTDADKGRFDFIRDGRRTVVEIQDPLLAEAVLGMESVGMQMWKPLAAAANFTRRTITLSPVFQLKQVFKDAPTAALVTGVKNPAALIGGVYKGFIDAVRDSDPAAGILRSVGIGGFYSPARTPEADVKRQIGIINNNTYDYVLKALDHFGDSSDMAQRIAIYNRVMAETGDEALAMYQAANVINFLRHGSGQVAQALVKTVPFLNAYAQSIDVLYNALIGGGLRGLDRKKAMQRLFITGSLLAGTTLLYAMLVGDDEDYMKMDDQSKVRSYIIPGTDVVLPMNTSAAFFFKAIPELTYNAIVSQGTENAMDEKRVRRALKESAVDLLLGPTPVPSAVKPVVEISLNYDFFTSRPVVPAGLKDLDAYQQYDMRTSEAAKTLSALTGGKENRLINPVEADHLIRGIFGTAGGMVAWSSNLIGEASEVRPAMGLKEMPITGAFLRPEVPRGREDLFYALKESTDRKFKTFNRLADRDIKEAEEYLQKHPNLISFYDYTSEMDTQLKELNAAIRFIAETTDRSYTPEMKRKEIQELLNLKQDILEGVEMFRREAYSE
jgi:hypothetical protein